MPVDPSAPARPLEGLRVLELARILAGPWAGQLLADLGCDVIKVERPGAGDDTRGWGPPFVAAAEGGHLDAAYFHSTNRGKRSIAVDFETEQGRAIVTALADRADILIENFKVGGLARFGLDYATLSARNPRLVYCSITGFGQDGPEAPRAGYDFMIQGMGGLMSLTGAPDGEPMKVGVAFADIFTGLYAVTAIEAALIARERTGKGAFIDMALLDTQVGVLANQAANYLVSGRPPRRLGNAHPNIVPYEVVPAADGHIIIAVGNDNQFRKLCAVIARPDLAAHPAYATNADRVMNRDALMPEVKAATARLPAADLLQRLAADHVPAGPINDLAAVFAEPQVAHRAMRITPPSPDAAAGHIPGVRSPILIDGAPAAHPAPAPRLGEHTAEVLAEIGWPAP